MEFFGHKSSELSSDDFDQLASLFNQIFEKSVQGDDLRAKYANPLCGESHHGLMRGDDGRIAGHMVGIPFRYDFFGRPAVFANAVDLMIDPDQRADLLSFSRIYDAMISASQGLYDFVYAVPNANSHLYFKKLLRWKDIGDLHYYLLPLRASKLDARLRGFDWASKIAAQSLSALPFGGGKEEERPIGKRADPEFIAYRFRSGYECFTEGDAWAYVRVFDEDSTSTAYVVGARPLDGAWLREVVKRVLRRFGATIDVVLYVGTEIAAPLNLRRVPEKFEPRKLTLVGRRLSDQIDDRVYDLANWRFDLMDWDTR